MQPFDRGTPTITLTAYKRDENSDFCVLHSLFQHNDARAVLSKRHHHSQISKSIAFRAQTLTNKVVELGTVRSMAANLIQGGILRRVHSGYLPLILDFDATALLNAALNNTPRSGGFVRMRLLTTRRSSFGRLVALQITSLFHIDAARVVDVGILVRFLVSV